MGYSRWDATAYATFSDNSARSIATARASGLGDTAARKTVFSQNKIHPNFDPKKVMLRESRDSDLNPNSVPIIIGVDVTGSMGLYAEKLAVEGLGRLIEMIIDDSPVTDPHIMVMGIGDIQSDEAPLQVSQFETDIRIAEQLKQIWLEGRGGGNNFESYDIPWYFAGTRTSIDSWEKRQKKGYIFTVGDEPPPPKKLKYSANTLNAVFGSGEQHEITSEEMLALAEEKYNVFHVIVEEGSCARRMLDRVRGAWKDVLGKRVINLRNYNYMPEVIQSVIRIAEGESPEEVAMSWEKPEIRDAVLYAIAD